jgi:hypothetical protein
MHPSAMLTPSAAGRRCKTAQDARPNRPDHAEEPIAQSGGQALFALPPRSANDTSRRLIGAKFVLIRASQRCCGYGLSCLAVRPGRDLRPIEDRLHRSAMSLRRCDGHGFISAAAGQVPERRRCPRTGANAPSGVLPRRTLQHRLNISLPRSLAMVGERRRCDTASRRAGR